MRFYIGGFWYAVRVAAEPIKVKGKLRRGTASHGDREILLSPHIRPETRAETLWHEVRHCWSWHVPRPSTDEEDCQLTASMGVSFQRDFDAGGGINALLLLKPMNAEPQPTEEQPMIEIETEVGPRRVPVGVDRAHRPRPRGDRAYCAACGSAVAASAVIVGAPRWDREARGNVRDLQFYCPACDHLQTVTLGCTIGNEADADSLMNAPLLERGKAADDFLVEHPEAAGVVIG